MQMVDVLRVRFQYCSFNAPFYLWERFHRDCPLHSNRGRTAPTVLTEQYEVRFYEVIPAVVVRCVFCWAKYLVYPATKSRTDRAHL